MTKHRLALFPIAATIGVLALVAWAAISLAQPPIPHPGPAEPGEPDEFRDCLFCHQSGVVGSPRVVSDHNAYGNEDCLACHEYLMHPDADFAHSDLLVGAHIDLWCEDCHASVQRPGRQCSDCHAPPTEPHFGTVCEDCHTPAGFAGADRGEFEHLVDLEGAHAEATCSACHIAGKELTFECAECHAPPSVPHYGTACEECHTPTTFEGARLPEGVHPVPLTGAHESAACEACHGEDEEPPEFVCSNCHEPPEDHLTDECDVCHTPEGFATSAVSIVDLAPVIPHTLEERDDCLLCHDPEGRMRPAPSNHSGHANEQCILCHKAAP